MAHTYHLQLTVMNFYNRKEVFKHFFAGDVVFRNSVGAGDRLHFSEFYSDPVEVYHTPGMDNPPIIHADFHVLKEQLLSLEKILVDYKAKEV